MAPEKAIEVSKYSLEESKKPPRTIESHGKVVSDTIKDESVPTEVHTKSDSKMIESHGKVVSDTIKDEPTPETLTYLPS